MVVNFTDPSLILLIGASGSGKSSFARRHFRSTEVLSSDYCRALVCDDENNQAATDDAFAVLHLILDKRLQRRRTTVVDATNVQISSRESLVAGARQWQVPCIGIVFELPEDICVARNRQRTHRQVPEDIIRLQLATLAAGLAHLEAEGFDAIFTLRSAAEIDTVTVARKSYS